MRDIWTIGHSTRTFDELARLLASNEVDAIADVRAHPGSRRLPHFNRDTLSEALGACGVSYHHLGRLGGRRRAAPDAPPTGWRVAAFHAYAAYMSTPEFTAALEELAEIAGCSRCAVMCAEAVPWRCHRTLISDALVARGFRVLHIISNDAPGEHTLTSFARVRDGRVSYVPEGSNVRTPSDRSEGADRAESRTSPFEQRDLFP